MKHLTRKDNRQIVTSDRKSKRLATNRADRLDRRENSKNLSSYISR